MIWVSTNGAIGITLRLSAHGKSIDKTYDLNGEEEGIEIEDIEHEVGEFVDDPEKVNERFKLVSDELKQRIHEYFENRFEEYVKGLNFASNNDSWYGKSGFVGDFLDEFEELDKLWQEDKLETVRVKQIGELTINISYEVEDE